MYGVIDIKLSCVALCSQGGKADFKVAEGCISLAVAAAKLAFNYVVCLVGLACKNELTHPFKVFKAFGVILIFREARPKRYVVKAERFLSSTAPDHNTRVSVTQRKRLVPELCLFLVPEFVHKIDLSYLFKNYGEYNFFFSCIGKNICLVLFGNSLCN